MKRLENKSCIITGGASGIGFAAVLRFLSEGARVVLADLNDEAGREKLDQLAALGHAGNVLLYQGDVSQEKDVIALMNRARQEFGGVDVVFNNAGIGGAFGRIVDTRVEDWDRTQAALLRSCFLCTKHAGRVMMHQQRPGSIINNAALAAHFGDLAGAAYSAAKAGVVNLTKTAAVQFAAHHIRVNSISPGFVMTPLLTRNADPQDLAQLLVAKQAWPEAGRPEHIAAVAAFLASDDATFITGADIVVDGGFAAGGRGLYQSGHPLGMAIAERMLRAGVRHFDYGSTGVTESEACEPD